MRILTERPRGCGHRKVGGAYLTGEIGLMGTLPPVVLIDPPIPVDTDIIPHSRGIYIVDFDAVLTESDQRKWLTGTSTESLRARDKMAWDMEQYGMALTTRKKTGICKGMKAAEVEDRLAQLSLRHWRPEGYVLNITRAGKGRMIAREVARMQEFIRAGNWRALLASCWRVTRYTGAKRAEVLESVKRLMAAIGAIEDAASV